MRAFLQAGRQEQWGVLFPARGLAELAKYLTDAGFPTGKEDITYAQRRKTALLEHCVPWVPETVTLLRVILARFPGFDYQRAFEAADAATLASFGFGADGNGAASEDEFAAVAPAAADEEAMPNG